MTNGASGHSYCMDPIRTCIFTDSKSCVDLSYDPVSFKKTKHILRAAVGLRDYVARQVYVMVHITGRINMADILTKAQAVSVFSELMGAYRLHTSAPSDKVADDGQEGVSRPNPSE